MYALIRQYEGLDAKTRQTATHKANDELRPILSKAPGFVSYELFKPEGDDGTVTSISVFNSRAEAEASSSIAREWVQKHLPDMTRPVQTAGELVAH